MPYEPFGPKLEDVRRQAGEYAASILDAMDNPNLLVLYQHGCKGLADYALELHKQGVGTGQIMAQLHSAAVSVTCQALGIEENA